MLHFNIKGQIWFSNESKVDENNLLTENTEPIVSRKLLKNIFCNLDETFKDTSMLTYIW